MAYGIICAMDEELAILKDALDNGTTEHYGHADFFIGQIHHQKWSSLNLELVKSKQELPLPS